MTYIDDTRALEIEWNCQCGSPGKQPINRTSPCFIAGQQAAYWGQTRSDCPHLPDGDAARHWLAGFDDEVNAAHDRERWTEQVENTGRGRW